MQLTYFIHSHTPQTLNDLIDNLKRHFPVTEISFIQQDQVMGG